MSGLMQVQFDATLDDFVDVTQRCLRRSKELRSWWSSEMYAMALVVGFGLYFAIPAGRWLQLSFALLGVGCVLMFYPVFQRKMVNRRLGRLCREQLGTRGTVKIEVGLSDRGVWVKQLDTEIFRDWKNVISIEETVDSIDIFMRDGTAVVVRKRAFRSEEENRQFLELAHHLFEAHR